MFQNEFDATLTCNSKNGASVYRQLISNYVTLLSRYDLLEVL